MLSNIVRATKTHYAALQHRKGPGRTRLEYTVHVGPECVTAGCVWVRVGQDGTHTRAHVSARRKAELTKLRNRLAKMYPEATRIGATFL